MKYEVKWNKDLKRLPNIQNKCDLKVNLEKTVLQTLADTQI